MSARFASMTQLVARFAHEVIEASDERLQVGEHIRAVFPARGGAYLLTLERLDSRPLFPDEDEVPKEQLALPSEDE